VLTSVRGYVGAYTVLPSTTKPLHTQAIKSILLIYTVLFSDALQGL